MIFCIQFQHPNHQNYPNYPTSKSSKLSCPVSSYIQSERGINIWTLQTLLWPLFTLWFMMTVMRAAGPANKPDTLTTARPYLALS